MSKFSQLKEKILKNYSPEDRRKFPFVYLLIAFPVVQMLVFWFYVNVSGVFLAFQDADGGFSFDAFQRVIEAFQGKDKYSFDLSSMLGKSVFIWGLTHIVLWVIGLFTTFILAKHMIGAKFFRVLYMIPGLFGSVINVTIWKNLFQYDGPIIEILQNMGVDLPYLALRNGLLGAEETAFTTLMVKNFIMGLCGGGLIMTGAFMRIPEEIFESAKLEGCGLFRETFQIAIPCVWPTLTTMMIFGFTSLFSSDCEAYLYSNGTGARGINTIGFYMYYMRSIDMRCFRWDYYFRW